MSAPARVYPRADIEGRRDGAESCPGVWVRVPGTEREYPAKGIGTVKLVCSARPNHTTAGFWFFPAQTSNPPA